jgi:NAD(P)-dependent dehydrogenase (short-subunit alcohol dehydrogenase family)
VWPSATILKQEKEECLAREVAHGFEQPIRFCNEKLAGVGSAIALALADRRCTVAIHYLKRQDAAEQVLAEVRERGADGFIVSGDMTQTDDIRHMIGHVRAEFGALDILVSNARPEFSEFYRSPLEMTGRSWDVAMDSQARAFLVAVQASANLLRDGGRIIATSYSPSTRYGSWQP